MKRVAMLLALCATAASCGGKVQAKTPGPAPSLTIPEPPGRLVVPVSIDPPSAPVTPDKPAPVSSPRPARPTPTPTPAATPSPVPPATIDTPPPPVLQTSANLAESEKKAVERLDRARADLGRVSRASLGKDAQDQYDSAERYIRMADDAIKVKNFPYAFFCADKAATLAGLLVK